MRFSIALLIALLSTASITSAQDEVVLGQRALDEGLQIVEVANDLAFPMGMTPLPDGSLLVATSPSESGNFYDSTGDLVRLFDSDADGTLDDRSVIASGLPGSLVAIVRFGELIAVTSAESGNEQIMFFRRGERWRDQLAPVETIRLHFVNALHQSYGLAVRDNPGERNAFDLFFNIGADGNDTFGANVAFDGIISGELVQASVYMLTIGVSENQVTFDDPVLVATGLRNGSALAIDPDSGDLWIGENGIDGFDDPIVAFSADELNRVPAQDIGDVVYDFGFPEGYTESATGTLVGDETADVVFLPIDGSEAEGVAGIALVPESFPSALVGGILAGFHGQFDLIGIDNEENPVRWVNSETGEQFDLISNESPGIGHLDSMVATADGIYLADFCSASMTDSQSCGAIYYLSPT